MENSNEIIDELKQNGCKIIQEKNGFKFGIDAVLLAWFCSESIRNNQSLVDLCTGTGIIPLLLSSSSRASHISALEIQDCYADMAQRSVVLNQLQEKIEVLHGDLKNIQNYYKKHSVENVTCNPPYMICDHGKQNPEDKKAIARFEVMCTLEDVVRAADYLLKPDGAFFMIHKPFRLPEIFSVFEKYHIEPKRMQLVLSHADEEPAMVLIEGRKNAGRRLKIEKPLVVYNPDGTYTQEINKIYGIN